MADYENGVYFNPIAPIGKIQRDNYLGGAPAKDYGLEELKTHFPTAVSIGVDEVLSTGIGFYYPTFANPSDSVTFKSQDFPRSSEGGRQQTILISGGGHISVYDGGWVQGIIEVSLSNILEIKRERFYNFLVNICKGALRTFQFVERYRDPVGGVEALIYTVRWIVPTFKTYTAFWLGSDITIQIRQE